MVNKKTGSNRTVPNITPEMKNNRIIRWLFGCLIFFTACRQAAPPETTRAPVPEETVPANRRTAIEAELGKMKKLIRTGDVITRTGNDFTSQSLRTLNRRDKTFSHCGIASIEHDSLFIYHALGGEWNPDQTLLRESFEGFTDPADNRAAGIFRFKISPEITGKLISTVQGYYRAKVKFDMAFDLKTDDKLYCAEFVYKSFLSASGGAIRFNHSFIRDFEFIGVDDITMHPLCEKIEVFNYGLY